MYNCFFQNEVSTFLVEANNELSKSDKEKLSWLLKAEALSTNSISGRLIGSRKEMVSPWSTNAVEIAANAGVAGIRRIEAFRVLQAHEKFDHMLEQEYNGLTLDTLVLTAQPAPREYVEDIEAFNKREGLALSHDEIQFLKDQQETLGRPYTDSELYGFSQINSEHCRHKIFNGTFIVDGEKKPKSLFQLIKDTSKEAPEKLVSAYKDNVAFVQGPKGVQFAPADASRADWFELKNIETVISIKAETHNFPTTVEPFYGASTGAGGEIRDRMAGGLSAVPLVGSAVYMTSYSRLGSSEEKAWEKRKARKWKYQTPAEILIKASNGASDFGNKFGQPLIVGSVLTFEGSSKRSEYAYDRTVMLAGGVGYAQKKHAIKLHPQAGDPLVLIGGDNYRIGMGGGSVSSVDTGAVSSALELSAIQRANPEMQKRAFNVIRALAELDDPGVRMIHDHGAGGHINCFSELFEETGGKVYLDKLPIGDQTLSEREIICNESQERMGLITSPNAISFIEQVGKRERAPVYVVGEADTSNSIVFCRKGETQNASVDLPNKLLFGSSPKIELSDSTELLGSSEVAHGIKNGDELLAAFKRVLRLEAVACKDWLTNKVDRSVTGKVAQQQCVGPLQIPLSNVAITAIDFISPSGIAASIGHAPVAGLIDERAGSILSVSEALTNIIWVPLEDGLSSVALSANWMWPAKQSGENARLYNAVEALSKFCIELGVPVPTGKDSMSMTMNYDDGLSVRAPGTVIVSAAAPCSDYRKVVTPDLKQILDSVLVYVNLSGSDLSPLGGSSLAQTFDAIGTETPTVNSAEKFKAGFAATQNLINEGMILAGHDVSSGGLITACAEMCFAGDIGANLTISNIDPVSYLFTERPGLVLQVEKSQLAKVKTAYEKAACGFELLGEVGGDEFKVEAQSFSFKELVKELRKIWFKTSFELDLLQTENTQAKSRFETLDSSHREFVLPNNFLQTISKLDVVRDRRERTGVRAAIIREKGTNGEREMAYAMYIAGFDVKDITMWDLVSGTETLEDVSFIVFPGGFSNSDVLGSARGWAASFLFNERAANSLRNFYARQDTLSLGVCNGCQLLASLDELSPFGANKVQLNHNNSGRFESIFLSVDVLESNSILLNGLSGSRLGIWVAHGEGKFEFADTDTFSVACKYSKSAYPLNPNGSKLDTAAIVSKDGRHLAMMPHLERSIFTWQWGYQTNDLDNPSDLTPWVIAFTNAKDWIVKAKK